MNDAAALNQFLAGVERRAFRMARFSVHDTDEALDIVQDAMLMLARRYAQRPAAEWPPLFFRILRNRITDFHRRRSVRAGIFSLFRGAASDGGAALEETIADGQGVEPEYRAQLDGATQQLERALQALPARQREAFLLRAWEGLDVAETARAMQCSAGSVKTHYFRAVHSLRESLGDDWP